MNARWCWMGASVTAALVVCAAVSAGEPASLVAHWEFEEGSGKIAYDSAGDHYGMIKGEPTWVQGALGQALHLNGVSDYVEVADDASLRPGHITISAWIKMDDLINHMMVISKGTYVGSSNEQYGVHVRIDGIYWRRAGMNIKRNSNNEPGYGWYRAYSKTLLEMNTWYLLTGTWDGASLRLYVNGVLEGQEWAPSGNIDNYPGGTVRIGRWRAGDEQRFHGCIDDVRIYNEALSAAEVTDLYLSNSLRYVAADGNDANPGNSPAQPFATIQKAIDVAKDGDTVLVYPGVYAEEVSFKGKAITVTSAGDAATIQSPGAFGVLFAGKEGSRSVLKNLIIKGSPDGVFIPGGTPTLRNLTIVSCGTGIKCLGGQPTVSNCILWDNTEADVAGCWIWYRCAERYFPAIGNISADPLFVDPAGGDYHLRSKAGRYRALDGAWIADKTTSPCLDAGDPADDWSFEPQPNGGRIDMGAHGGSPYTSKSAK